MLNIIVLVLIIFNVIESSRDAALIRYFAKFNCMLRHVILENLKFANR